MKPNFFVIGAMKSGTTGLRRALSLHPEVFWQHPEVRYFCSKNYEKGLDWYLEHFEEASYKKAIGDGAGYDSYFSACPQTAERMKKDFPDAKIIYLVRHPIDRLASHWAWAVSSGRKIGPLSMAVESYNPLVEMSLYWFQISAYRKYFSDENIKILFLEDLKSDANMFYKTCFDFLGVDANFVVPDAQKPVNITKGRLTDSPLLLRLRLLPGSQVISSLVSGRARQALKNVFKTRRTLSPDWSSGLKESIESKIVPDSIKFLDYCKKDKDFWTFEHY